MSVPVRFRESFEVLQRVEQVEHALPAQTRSEIQRRIFRLGLQVLEVKLIKNGGSK